MRGSNKLCGVVHIQNTCCTKCRYTEELCGGRNACRRAKVRMC